MQPLARVVLRLAAQERRYEPRRGRPLPDWVVDEAKALRASGWTWKQLARKYGVTHQAVGQWMKRWGM